MGSYFTYLKYTLVINTAKPKRNVLNILSSFIETTKARVFLLAPLQKTPVEVTRWRNIILLFQPLDWLKIDIHLGSKDNILL